MARKYAPNRIRALRKEAGLSQEELGGRMRAELTGSTIAKLETGNMALSVDYLNDIARVLGVAAGNLLESGGLAIRSVPLIGLVSAGNWEEAVQLTEDNIPIPEDIRGEHLFALRPDGDSMDKLIAPGSEGGFIVVNPDDKDLVDRKYYVVQDGEGEATFRQFCASPLSLLPCSNNPEHQPISLGSKPFTVIGRVVYVGQQL